MPGRGSFAVELFEEDSTLLAVVHGDLDIVTVPGLWRALEERLPFATRLVLDLGDVPFLGSAAFGAMIRAADRLREHGGTVVVRNLAGNLRPMFELTGMHNVVQLA